MKKHHRRRTDDRPGERAYKEEKKFMKDDFFEASPASGMDPVEIAGEIHRYGCGGRNIDNPR